MKKCIVSKENKKYKWIKKIIKKSSKSEYFLIEGRRAIEQAIENGFEPVDIVGTDIKDETLTFILDYKLFDEISGVVASQQIIGIFKKRICKLFDAKKYLVLDRISDPGNLGTILRTALAFGYNSIILTSGSVSVYNPKVIRSSLSAILELNIYENVDIAEVKDILSDKYVVSASLNNANNYRDIDYPKNVSIIIGNEANGICDELLEFSTQKIYIPMSNKMESLNAAVASGILLEYFYTLC